MEGHPQAEVEQPVPSVLEHVGSEEPHGPAMVKHLPSLQQ